MRARRAGLPTWMVERLDTNLDPGDELAASTELLLDLTRFS